MELAETFNLATEESGTTDAGFEKLLWGLDSLKLVCTAREKERIATAGKQIYNVIRAIEPATKSVLQMRLWSIRCMECDESKDSIEVLLCYCRSGRKVLHLISTDELQDTDQHLACLCFQRGFSIMTLGDALSLLSAMPRSEDNANYAYTIVETILSYTCIEIESSVCGINKELLKSLADMWLKAVETLFSLAKVQYLLDQIAQVVRSLAKTLYLLGCNYFGESLDLFNSLHMYYPNEANEEKYDDLLIIADMYSEIGDRGLGFAAINTMNQARKTAHNERKDFGYTTLNEIIDEGQKLEEKTDIFENFALGIKEDFVLVKLNALELGALSSTMNLTEDTLIEYDLCETRTWASYENLVARIRTATDIEILDSANQQTFFTDVLSLGKTACKEICSSLQFSYESIRKTFWLLEQVFFSMDIPKDISAQLHLLSASTRVGLLQHFSPVDPFIVEILEALGSAILPFDLRVVQKTLRTRMQMMVETKDSEGVISTGSILVVFASINDTKLAGTCHIIVGEYLLGKAPGELVLAKAKHHAQEALDLLGGNSLRALLVKFRSCGIKNTIEAANALERICESNDVSADQLLQSAQHADKLGILPQAILALKRSIESGKKDLSLQMHLVSLRLTFVGVSPTLLSCDKELCLDTFRKMIVDKNEFIVQLEAMIGRYVRSLWGCRKKDVN